MSATLRELADARVVHERVEPAELPDGLAHEHARRRPAPHIGCERPARGTRPAPSVCAAFCKSLRCGR